MTESPREPEPETQPPSESKSDTMAAPGLDSGAADGGDTKAVRSLAVESLASLAAVSSIMWRPGMAGGSATDDAGFVSIEGMWESANLGPEGGSQEDANDNEARVTRAFEHSPGAVSIEASAVGTIGKKTDRERRESSDRLSLPGVIPFARDGAGDDPAAPYVVEEELGKGGQGVVWRGWQRSLSREVAVKQYKGRNYDEFLREAYTTASLDHPNIVPVHDLSILTDENGRDWPLMSMKRLKGRSWDHVLAAESRAADFNWDAHLERHGGILLDVTNALAFAHAHQVIHRDLKPSQVMIGEFGEVYLGDWGLAVFIGQEVPRALADGRPKFHTRDDSSAPAGTPAYMAPEQTAYDNDHLGFATDVYLLGAILFEIVSGEAPHAGRNAREAFVAAEENRLRPLPAWCPAELRDFVLRCLETDPQRRPPGVASFRSELERLLGGLSTRRRSAEIAEEVAGELETLRAERAELTTSDLYARRNMAARQLTQALTLWPANLKARRLREVNLTERVDEEIGLGDLSLAAVHLGDLAGTELTSAEVSTELAALRDRHNSAEARRHRVRRQRIVLSGLALFLFVLAVGLAIIAEFRAEQAIASERFASERLSAAESLIRTITSELYWQLDLEDEGQRAIAESYANTSLEYLNSIDVEPLSPESQVRHAEALRSFSGVFKNIGNQEMALELARRSGRVFEVHLGPTSEAFLSAKTAEAAALLEIGQVPEAVALFAELRPLYEQYVDPDSAARAEHDRQEAFLHLGGIHPEDARELLENAIRIRRLRDDTSDAQMSALIQQYTIALASAGEIDAALQAAEEQLAAARESADELSPAFVDLLNNYGIMLARAGKHAKAAKVFEEVIPLYRKVLGPDDHRTYVAISSLASMQHYRGRGNNTLELYEQAAEGLQRTLGTHQETAVTLNNMGLFLEAHRNYPRAEEVFLKVLPLLEELHGPQSEIVAQLYFNLSWVYENWGKYDKEVEAARKALEIAETWDEMPYLFAIARGRLARGLAMTGRAKEAIVEEIAANELRLEHYHADDILVLGHYRRLAEYYGRAGDIASSVATRARIGYYGDTDDPARRSDVHKLHGQAMAEVAPQEWDRLVAAGASDDVLLMWRRELERSLVANGNYQHYLPVMRWYLLEVGAPLRGDFAAFVIQEQRARVERVEARRTAAAAEETEGIEDVTSESE